MNAVVVGAVPQRELAGQHRGQCQAAGTLDCFLLRQLRSLPALDAWLQFRRDIGLDLLAMGTDPVMFAPIGETL
jgi:hypothetical protein